MKKCLLVFLLALPVSCVFVACGDPDPVEEEPLPWTGGGLDPEVASLIVEPAHLELSYGESAQLEVTFFDDEEELLEDESFFERLRWESADPSVAVVDEEGVVTAVGHGEVVVRAIYRDVDGEATVNAYAGRWRQVSAGEQFSCAVSWEGEVYCWGSDRTGELAKELADRIEESTPILVNLPARAVGVTAGEKHACAWTEDEHLYCWGDNRSRQTGQPHGDIVPPSRVANLNVVEAQASATNTCALTAEGTLYCWGSNEFGQSGDTSGWIQAAPVALAISEPVIGFAAGAYHGCAVTESHALYCWGYNVFRAVDAFSSDDVVVPPRHVVPAENVLQAAVSLTVTCALTAEHEVLCWGMNGNGQLGPDLSASSELPKILEQVPEAVELSASREVVCARTEGQKLYCWGGNARGELGQGMKSRVGAPSAVLGTQHWRSVSVGVGHVCALDEDFELWCWGENTFGQVGDGREFLHAPTAVASGDVRFSRLVAGWNNVCGQSTAQGSWYCWGQNHRRQLQEAGVGHLNTPQLLGPWEADEVSLAMENGCGISFANPAAPDTRCWGVNPYGQLGIASPALLQHPATPLNTDVVFQSVSSSLYHGCAVSTDSQIHCWGGNYFGEVGMSPDQQSRSPRLVEERSDYVKVTTGVDHSCGLTEEGRIRCWGEPQAGQLGRSPFGGRAPGYTAHDDEFIDVQAGAYLTCARTADLEIKCWGVHQVLGGSSNYGASPRIFEGQWDELAVGKFSLCARRGGDVYCAGWNTLEHINPEWPELVDDLRKMELGFETSQIAVGYTSSCALDVEGLAHCWGVENYGQLGHGAAIEYFEPRHLDF